MNKLKIFAGILVFGSLWGAAECILAPMLTESGLPSGAIMAGAFAIGLMILSRSWFKQPGMQLCMGLIAGVLRLFNPFGSCIICSAIAIAAEGLIFEIIWYTLVNNKISLKSPVAKVSLGICTAYLCYVGGYVVTQVLTPVVSSSSFYLSNLLSFLPQIFSRGILPALIGAMIAPLALSIPLLDIETIKNKVYYPTTFGIAALAWILVIGNFLMSA